MKPQKEIEQLQQRIKELEEKKRNCKHDFEDPIYDPETEMQGYGSVQDGAGSDPHWSYEGYRPVEKPRWSKECKLCGHKEYTYKQSPVIKEYKPDFS